MKPEGSFPWLREPAICPCREPYQSSPRPPNRFPQDPHLCYPPTHACVFQDISFTQVSSTTSYALLLTPFVKHAPSISLFLMLSSEYLVMSTNHEIPHRAVPPFPCYIVPLRHLILSHRQPVFFHQRKTARFTAVQKLRKCKVKVRAIPIQAWTDPEGSTRFRFQISRQSAHGCGNIVSPTHRPPLPSRRYPWYSFLSGTESSPRP